MEPHKIIVSGTNVYKEIELWPDMKHVRIGTLKECHFHLDREAFFEDFELHLTNDGATWNISCSGNTFLSIDGLLKQNARNLVHGDEVVLKSAEGGQTVVKLSFVLNFDHETPDHHRSIDLAGVERVRLGGQPGCDILLQDPLMENEVVTLVKHQGIWYVQDAGTRYGAYVNGNKVNGQAPLRDFDFLSVVGYSFYLRHDTLYTSLAAKLHVEALNVTDLFESTEAFQYPKFNHGTRIKQLVPDEEIELLDPPAMPQKPEQKIIATLMPAIAGVGITVGLRYLLMNNGNNSMIILMAATSALGIITTIAGFITGGRDYKKNTAKRIADYNAYIEQKRVLIAERRKQEAQILEGMYFSPKRCLHIVQNFTSDLFNRTPQDEDYLHVRLGMGMLPSRQPVKVKEQETFENEDPLADIPLQVVEEFRHISKGPIVVDLNTSNAVGVVGTRNKLYNMMKTMLLDICVRQFYQDVQVFIFAKPEHAGQFSWARLMPHLQNDNMRNFVCDEDSKNILYEYLYKLLSAREAEKITTPNIIFFVYDDMGIKSHPLSRYISKASELGVTFVFFEEKKELLPVGCDYVIKLRNGEDGGVLVSSQNATLSLDFAYTPLDELEAQSVAEKLAPVYCEEISLEASLTKNITLFELLEIYSVDDLDIGKRWEESVVYDTMAAPLGVKAGDEVVALDLHEKYHGPHGLVAGTTGSGKSEILQSYILSMATLFHPYEVSFVIIDFKGGGMVNQFKDLPHLNGAITNIDGREIDRSLLSIKAELKKRQELFSQQNVNHINAYIKAYKKGEAKIPLPHLILVVDEFAELKMDQPEFMKELISAARIGRSLGVHLILATQKPSGVVDAQIWSNSKFKLCLKVQNKEDSNEVLKTPLAAEIKEPGRAYLQVGNNEIFELFQSAYSGAPASKDESANKKKFKIFDVALSGMKRPVYEYTPPKSAEESETQLDAIVQYVAAHAKKNGIQRLPGICMPPLPDVVPYSEGRDIQKTSQLSVPLGFYDDPNRQLQEHTQLALLSGNTFLVGSTQNGKTSLLQLLIRGVAENYTPEEANIYVLDFGSMALRVFNDLAHVGGVVTASEDEKLKNFLRMIDRELKSRKEKFAKLGITSYASYREAGYTDLPAVVVLLDNFIAFRELYPDYDDNLLNLCREGTAVGICVVATSQQTSGVSFKYMSNFPNRIGLYCNSGDEYSSLFERTKMRPKSVPGRGLLAIDKVIYEYQTYLAFEGEREIERVEAIRAFIQQVNEDVGTSAAKPIPAVPAKLNPQSLAEMYPQLPPYVVPMGIDYDTVDAVPANLVKQPLLVVTGKEQSGRTNFVCHLLSWLDENSAAAPCEIHIIDGYERQLERLETLPSVKSYTTDGDNLESFLQEMESMCEARRAEIRLKGATVVQALPLVVVAVQNEMLFDPSLPKTAVASYKNLLKLGKETRLCVVFAQLEDMPISLGAGDVMKTIKETRNIVYFGDMGQFKMLDVGLATLKLFKKPIELGDAYYITEMGVNKIKTPELSSRKTVQQ